MSLFLYASCAVLSLCCVWDSASYVGFSLCYVRVATMNLIAPLGASLASPGGEGPNNAPREGPSKGLKGKNQMGAQGKGPREGPNDGPSEGRKGRAQQGPEGSGHISYIICNV